MLRLELNENVPAQAVTLLRARGHDVRWAVEDAPGWRDPRILERAVAENRVVVTFDKDFGELVFRRRLPASCGVVLLRLSSRSPDEVAQRLVDVLEEHADAIAGHFTVVSDERVRIVPLPASGRDDNDASG